MHKIINMVVTMPIIVNAISTFLLLSANDAILSGDVGNNNDNVTHININKNKANVPNAINFGAEGLLIAVAIFSYPSFPIFFIFSYLVLFSIIYIYKLFYVFHCSFSSMTFST